MNIIDTKIDITLSFGTMREDAVLEVSFEPVPAEPDIGQYSAGYVINQMAIKLTPEVLHLIAVSMVADEVVDIQKLERVRHAFTTDNLRIFNGRLEIENHNLETEVSDYLSWLGAAA